MSWYGSFRPYVSVAKRKQESHKEVEKLKKKGKICQPVVIQGRTIATTFWGKAWCDHLESYSDYANRLPRGRTYVRNGSVIDLNVMPREITALVSGSSIYKIKITIDKVTKNKWNQIVGHCAGKIDSLIELLQGKFSKAVMQLITDPARGLFPNPKEIKLSCSCPDWAEMCKHVSAVLYGIGARLDNKPEELFLLRQADHLELIAKAGTASLTQDTMQNDQTLDSKDLSTLFGIDLDSASAQNKKSSNKTKAKKPRTTKIVRKKVNTKIKKINKSKKRIAKKPKPPTKTKKTKSKNKLIKKRSVRIKKT